MIEALTEDPATTALLFDLDGTLAAITEDPDETIVSEDVVARLGELAEAFGLVAIVTGRALDRSFEMLGTDDLAVAAVHGMHMHWPDGRSWLDPAAEAARPQLDIAVQMARTVGWRYEDKQAAVALHFRHLKDPEHTARQMKSQIATVIDPRTIVVYDAKQAVELRPRGGATKGDAIEHLLREAEGEITRVLYAGDDMTDVDAFERLADMDAEAHAVAVDSDETPDAVTDAATEVVDGVEALHELVEELAAAVR